MPTLHGARVALLESRLSTELAELVRRMGGTPVRPRRFGRSPPGGNGGVRRQSGVGPVRARRFFKPASGRPRCCGTPSSSGRWPMCWRRLARPRSCAAGPNRRRSSGDTDWSRRSSRRNRSRPGKCSRRSRPSIWQEAHVALVHYGERNAALADALRGRGARPGRSLPVRVGAAREPRAAARDRPRPAAQLDAIAFTSQVQVRNLFAVAEQMGLREQLAASLNERHHRRRGRTGLRRCAQGSGCHAGRPASGSEDGTAAHCARRLHRADARIGRGAWHQGLGAGGWGLGAGG